MNNKYLYVIIILLCSFFNGYSQLSINSNDVDYTIDFESTITGVNNGPFDGSGWNSTPSSGQLDADAWAQTGMSDGSLVFGANGTTGDYARNSGSVLNFGTGVTVGGWYAFDINGGKALGIQPTGSDWASGSLTLKIQNNTGSTITSIGLGYDIICYNDQLRSNSFNFSHSSDDIIYTSEASLNYESPEASDSTIITSMRDITITNLSLSNGSFYYLRWEGSDISGSFSRDEFAVDNITINSQSVFNITYSGNGNTDGSAPEDTTSYNSGSTVTVLGQSTLVKPCYVFSGWNTAADGSGIGYTAGNTFTISNSTTLYAQWVFDTNCDMIMISQYYEGTSSNKWIEIKNISGSIIPANSFYLAVYNKGTAEQPLDGVPSNVLLIPPMFDGEIIRFKEPLTSEPNYTNTDGVTSEIMFANSFSGNDIIVISTTNDANCYNNRVDIIGEYTEWGSLKCFIRNSCIADGPSRSFDINDWIEFSITEVNETLPGTNLYLGDHFDGVTNFNGVGDYNGWVNGLPERSRSVTVTADYDTGLKGSFDACTITTASDKIINVRADDYITIVNDLTVNARGVLNIDHEGSLIMFNDSGTITNDGDINVYRSTSTMEQYDYHYWSSPIDYSTNTTPVASVLTDFFASRIYAYNTSAYNDTDDDNDNIDDEQDDWVNYSSDMKSGIGYAAMTSSPGERNTIFSGKVNNGVISVNVALSNDENGDEDGDEDDWNLLGNPYPSAISADEFITQNSTINGTLYFWTHVDDISIDNPGPDTYNYSTDDYAMYSLAGGVKSESNSAVPTGIIETGLGFFVDAISQGSVEFNNSMRSKSYANNNSFSASSTNEIIEKDRFWLNLTNPNGAFSQILIGFFENATLEKDRLYDGVRLKGSNYIDFYSLDNTSYEYGIQGRPAFDENESIVLGYQSNILGNLSIDLGDREGVLSETPIYITDHYLSITHDLTIAPYSFNTEVGTFNDRFEIAFNEESLSTNDIKVDTKTLQINELQNGQVQIKVPSQFEMASIQIMDISGKVIYNFSTQGYSQTFSLNNLSKTAYLVTVELNNGQTITKKAIKRK